MTDYGYKNDWRGHVPAKVEFCEADGHEKDTREIFNGVTEYHCSICEYVYKVDHGD